MFLKNIIATNAIFYKSETKTKHWNGSQEDSKRIFLCYVLDLKTTMKISTYVHLYVQMKQVFIKKRKNKENLTKHWKEYEILSAFSFVFKSALK